MLDQERQPERLTPEDAQVCHLYPRTPGIGPERGPGPGAVARCGYVKRTPRSGRVWNGREDGDVCVVCVELAKAEME